MDIAQELKAVNIEKLLLVALIDRIAREHPNKCHAMYPKSTNVKDGFRNLTYGQLAQAIDYTAWFLKKEIGTVIDGEVVGYIGPPDLRYLFFVFAAHKTGLTV